MCVKLYLRQKAFEIEVDVVRPPNIHYAIEIRNVYNFDDAMKSVVELIPYMQFT